LGVAERSVETLPFTSAETVRVDGEVVHPYTGHLVPPTALKKIKSASLIRGRLSTLSRIGRIRRPRIDTADGSGHVLRTGGLPSRRPRRGSKTNQPVSQPSAEPWRSCSCSRSRCAPEPPE